MLENYCLKVESVEQGEYVKTLFQKLGYNKVGEFLPTEFAEYGGWVCALDDGGLDYCPTASSDHVLTVEQLENLVSKVV